MKRKRAYPNLRAYLAHRRAQGVTQRDIAAFFQISPGHLSDLKKGRGRPSLALAMRLEACGIPLESFQ